MGSKPSKDVNDDGHQPHKKSTKKAKKLLETVDDHDDAINCMTLSDDTSLLVTGGEDFTARMWSTKTDTVECLGVLEGHEGYITCISIVDTYVITGSADTTIRKWDMTSCDCLFVYKAHTCRVSRIICTGEFIFSSGYDKLAMAWLFDAQELGEGNESRALVRVFKGHAKAVYPLVFIPADGIPTEVEVEENQMDINPGDLLITGSADCTARSWSIATGGCLKVFEGHTMPIMCMSADNFGKVLFTGGGDSTVKSWDLRSGTLLRDFDGHGSAIIGLQVVGKMLFTMSCDQTARSWVTEFGDCTCVFSGHNHSVTCLKYCDGTVFTGCGDGVVRAFDAKAGSLRDEFKDHQGSVTALALVDAKLYTSCADGKLRVFDVSHLIDISKRSRRMSYIARTEIIGRNNEELEELEQKLDSCLEEPDLNVKGIAASVTGKSNQVGHLPGVVSGCDGLSQFKGKASENIRKMENHTEHLKSQINGVESQVQRIENHAQQLKDAVSSKKVPRD